MSVKSLWARIHALVTGVVEWVDPDTGEVTERDHLSWRDRWALFGIHSWDWRWVRRYGKQGCGCTLNPITRRKVLTRLGCPEHCPMDWLDDDLEEADRMTDHE
jgi:hypothetical protein